MEIAGKSFLSRLRDGINQVFRILIALLDKSAVPSARETSKLL